MSMNEYKIQSPDDKKRHIFKLIKEGKGYDVDVDFEYDYVSYDELEEFISDNFTRDDQSVVRDILDI